MVSTKKLVRQVNSFTLSAFNFCWPIFFWHMHMNTANVVYRLRVMPVQNVEFHIKILNHIFNRETMWKRDSHDVSNNFYVSELKHFTQTIIACFTFFPCRTVEWMILIQDSEIHCNHLTVCLWHADSCGSLSKGLECLLKIFLVGFFTDEFLIVFKHNLALLLRKIN